MRIWHGGERLWKVYWVVGILGGWALATLIGSLIRGGFLTAFLGAGLAVIYAVFTGVAIWRCAFNVRRPIWGYAARTIVLVSAIYFVVAMARAVMSG